MKRLAVVLAIASAVGLGALFLRMQTPTPRLADAAESEMVHLQPRSAIPRIPAGPLHYLAIGGGATPESTEVSLEQDLGLAAEVLPKPGLVLFGGGPDALSVRVLDSNLSVSGDAVLVRLGDLFQPRSGRQSRYRKSRLTAQRASWDDVEQRLESALSVGRDPLTLFIAAHGEQGSEPRENSIPLWGGEALTVERLSNIHEAHPRPMRVIVAACFAGGFAELAFDHADEHRGITRAPRCGLFAGPWDRETSGCDPNPDRRTHESYSLHLLQALKGRGRDGHAIDMKSLDVDHDGKVSLLEAHTFARIAAVSIDVPTTTSERFLRAVQTKESAPDHKLLPEEWAVVDRLGHALELGTEAAAKTRWHELDERLETMQKGLDNAEQELSRRSSALSAALLAKWPVLDDPYHPDFARTLSRDRDAIRHVLDESEEARAYNRALQQLDALDDEFWGLTVQEARVLRLLRSYETLGMATALRNRDKRSWSDYSTLLQCERGAP